MAFDVQAWNPTLLAALAKPNEIDYATRMSNMDLNSAQRQKMLAELAYLPARQKNEELKNKVYALQQGYTIDPATGGFVPTAAKQAQLNSFNALLQALGGGQSSQATPQSAPPAQQQSTSIPPVDVNTPQMASMNPWMQAAMGVRGPQDAARGAIDYTGQTAQPQISTDDSAQAPVVDFGSMGVQPEQPTSQEGGQGGGEVDPKLGMLAALAGQPQLATAVNQYIQRGIDDQKIGLEQQKIEQKSPEGQAKAKKAVGDVELNLERQKNKTKVLSGLNSFAQQAEIIDKNIDKALETISPWSTGYGNMALSGLPNTDARKLNNYLSTIKANVGFDKLQQMRENSPTGGALGQVSDFENKLLQAVNGALDPLQADQLKDNLSVIKDLYPKVLKERRQAFKADFGGGKSSTKVEKNIDTTESKTSVPNNGIQKFDSPSSDEFKKLPAGARFMDANGKVRIKH